MNTKFFKVSYDPCELPCLYVCDEETPIPTAAEIVERNNLAPFCVDGQVVEISMKEFLRLHNEILYHIADSANDMMEWSPNAGSICSWEWWDSAEVWAEVEG